MPKASIQVQVGVEPPEETAAAYLAILAHPVDLRRRLDFRLALVTDYLRSKLWDREFANTYHPMRPELLAYDRERCRSIIDKGVNAIKDRRDAFKIALPILLNRELKGFVSLDLDAGPPNIERMIEGIAAADGRPNSRDGKFKAPDSDKGNVRHRIWVKSKPVLHLAGAFETAVADQETLGRENHVTVLLDRTKWVREAIVRAETIRKMLIETPELNVSDDNTIQVLMPQFQGFNSAAQN